MLNLSQSFETLLTNIILFLPKVVVSLIVFAATLFISSLIARLIERRMERRGVSREATLLLSKLARWSIIALGLTMALQQVDFNVTAFLTGLGVIGFTIGFALQDVSKNFVAGLLLLLQRPFRLGDGVTIGGYSGAVQAVNLRATEIRTWDGKYVLIPNADVFASPITNFSRDTRRRLELNVGVAYGTDLERARAIALETIAAIPGVQSEPAPRVVYGNLGPATVDFILYYWIDTGEVGFFDAKDAGVVRILEAFDAAGIEMPYPTQTVRLVQVG
ncbi:MAG: mechanosensitive ion channel [Anaerolineae bacterium]|nr:mechanosensitive ion channel [Anaerolineae bacterium]